MKQITNWFFRPVTTKFKFVGFATISIIFLVWLLLLMNGCKSFEKQTGYKPNTYWGA